MKTLALLLLSGALAFGQAFTFSDLAVKWGAGGAQPSPPATNGFHRWYGNGDALDTGTVTVNDAVWEGTETYTNGRHSDLAFYFDGSSNLTNAGLQTLITGKVYSVTAWVQPDSTTMQAEGGLFAHPNDSNGYVDTRYYFQSSSFVIADYGGATHYLGSPNNAQWLFISIVTDFNLGTCKYYTNGVFATSVATLGTAADTAGDLNPPNGYFTIGSAYFPYTGSSGGFGGAIQDFRLYQGAMSTNQIWQVYTNTL